jgi:DNA-binding CsgD family transcriptional regulator
VARLTERFPLFAELHTLDARSRVQDRGAATGTPGVKPRREPVIPDDLWPELSRRERELVQLILAGHPTATIADRLAIAVGTVKNHRRRIYEKLDITTERELFLGFFEHGP